MDFEIILLYVSFISLVVAGSVLIYEGSVFIEMRKQNPSISEKIYVAAVLAIVFGVADIAFAFFHFYLFPRMLNSAAK